MRSAFAFLLLSAATARVRIPLSVPNAPSLAAGILAVQALDYAPSTGLETPNPSVVVLR